MLLLDEPTRGVDVGAKFDIYTLTRALSAKRTAVIITSSDLPELIGMCDRILIMRGGAQHEIVHAARLNSAPLPAKFYDWGRPQMITFFKRYGTLLGYVAIILFFWFNLPDTFMTARNWLNISRKISMLAVIAFTMTIVMVMGYFELSVGQWRACRGSRRR